MTETEYPWYVNDAAREADLQLNSALYAQDVSWWLPFSIGYTERLLRAAGCPDLSPLLGWRPQRGPRCRLCSTIADLPTVLLWEALLQERNKT